MQAFIDPLRSIQLTVLQLLEAYIAVVRKGDAAGIDEDCGGGEAAEIGEDAGPQMPPRKPSKIPLSELNAAHSGTPIKT